MLNVENPVLKSSAQCLLILASSSENYSEGEGADEVRLRLLDMSFKKKKTFWIACMLPAAYIIITAEEPTVGELSKPLIYFPTLDLST